MPSKPRLIPVLHVGIVQTAGGAGAPGLTVRLQTQDNHAVNFTPVSASLGQILIDPIPQGDVTLHVDQNGAPVAGSPLQVQVGGFNGAVEWVHGRVITGRARNLRKPGQDVSVVGYTASGRTVFATAMAAEGGRFVMLVPEGILDGQDAESLTLGVAGSDYVLEDGLIAPQRPARRRTLKLQSRPLSMLALRIKISTPNLKEAPMWGDYHFATALRAAFEAIGQQANVDTVDTWYQRPAQEDVVLTLRGRNRLTVDPGKINIMWLISHPDRIPDDEYADYDHICVASDIYAAILRGRGLPSVSVLHQATDAALFSPLPDQVRTPRCLFVGSSRREYRTMVKWCVESEVPFDLYGGGWEGILPAEMLRAASIANQDLPACYGSHLILLNDHWDSMRDNGFLSNRLFDGSAVATPMITDPVAGLADVFGDSIATADTRERFADLVQDCLANPEPYLARARAARDIVLGAHTFDHRARQLSDIIDRLVAVKRR